MIKFFPLLLFFSSSVFAGESFYDIVDKNVQKIENYLHEMEITSRTIQREDFSLASNNLKNKIEISLRNYRRSVAELTSNFEERTQLYIQRRNRTNSLGEYAELMEYYLEVEKKEICRKARKERKELHRSLYSIGRHHFYPKKVKFIENHDGFFDCFYFNSGETGRHCRKITDSYSRTPFEKYNLEKNRAARRMFNKCQSSECLELMVGQYLKWQTMFTRHPFSKKSEIISRIGDIRCDLKSSYFMVDGLQLKVIMRNFN